MPRFAEVLAALHEKGFSGSALFAVSQFVFYLVYGPIVGATAGFLSGRAMMEALPSASEPERAGYGLQRLITRNVVCHRSRDCILKKAEQFI